MFFYKEKFKYFIILLLAFSLSTITYQAFNEYSLRLAYGERGLRSVIKWGEANVNRKDSSYAVKDLTYALFNVNNYNEGIFEYGENIESHLQFIQARKPKYVMYRDYWIPRNKSIFFSQQLEDWGYTLRYQTGNFIVYDREPKP